MNIIFTAIFVAIISSFITYGILKIRELSYDDLSRDEILVIYGGYGYWTRLDKQRNIVIDLMEYDNPYDVEMEMRKIKTIAKFHHISNDHNIYINSKFNQED